MDPRKKGIKITFHAKLPIVLEHKKKHVVACCPILDVHSQGNTKEEAKKNIREALSLFLISCFERGVLDKVLRDSGFEILPAELAKKTQSIEPGFDSVNVPLPFMIPAISGRCHV